MKYMIQMNVPADQWDAIMSGYSKEDMEAMFAHMTALNEDLTAAGEWVEGQGLGGPSLVKTVRAGTDGRPQVTDGPAQGKPHPGRVLGRRRQERGPGPGDRRTGIGMPGSGRQAQQRPGRSTPDPRGPDPGLNLAEPPGGHRQPVSRLPGCGPCGPCGQPPGRGHFRPTETARSATRRHSVIPPPRRPPSHSPGRAAAWWIPLRKCGALTIVEGHHGLSRRAGAAGWGERFHRHGQRLVRALFSLDVVLAAAAADPSRDQLLTPLRTGSSV